MIKYSLVSFTTVMHFLVDGLCMCCLLMTCPFMSSFETMLTVFVTYNVIAFMSQPFTGMLVDKAKQMHYPLLASAISLFSAVILSVALNVFSDYTLENSAASCILIAILLGVGNSLFHVWGGKQVIYKVGNDMRALGPFVSTGVMGLAVGNLFSSWLLLYLLLFAYCACCFIYLLFDPQKTAPAIQTSSVEITSGKKGKLWLCLCVLGLGVFVMLRSYIGETISTDLESFKNLALILALISMFGKSLGGWIAKYVGVTTTLCILLSVLVICMFEFVLGTDYGVFIGLFAINCTMPITLYLCNDLLKGKEGLSFGILAAALIPGYFLAKIEWLDYKDLYWILWPLIATMVVEYGVLRLLGERNKRLLLSSLLVNILTNIPLNIFLTFISNSILVIVIGELIVVLIEAAWYYWFLKDIKKSFIYSALCNAISFLVGLVYLMIMLYIFI